MILDEKNLCESLRGPRYSLHFEELFMRSNRIHYDGIQIRRKVKSSVLCINAAGQKNLTFCFWAHKVVFSCKSHSIVDKNLLRVAYPLLDICLLKSCLKFLQN